mgnify:FL=1
MLVHKQLTFNIQKCLFYTVASNLTSSLLKFEIDNNDHQSCSELFNVKAFLKFRGLKTESVLFKRACHLAAAMT